MSCKPIHEFNGKRLLSRYLSEHSHGAHEVEHRLVQVTADVADDSKPDVTYASIAAANPWLLDTQLVVKPDQLIKRRGKAGLVGLNLNWEQVQAWIGARMNRDIQVETVTGVLNTFIVEPMVPHEQSDEHYICIMSDREGEEILFCHDGGVDVGDVDTKAARLHVDIDGQVSSAEITDALLGQLPEERKPIVASFVEALFKLYRDLHFSYMEINPICIVGNRVFALDMAAKLDETAHYLVGEKWGHMEFPAAFGRPEMPEEAYIRELDSKTGSSLKLSILNPAGRVWTMVAGGGASVVYADVIADLGFAPELANYGEYSGAPSEAHTYEYAKTVLSLMCREHDDRGKVLIIGGGIANFTDVAATFKGIIRALKDHQVDLRARNVKIWVRRGGPNYLEGLQRMKDAGVSIGVPIAVYGPETHITSVVPWALELAEPAAQPNFSGSGSGAEAETSEAPAASPTASGSSGSAGEAKSEEAAAATSSGGPAETQTEEIERENTGTGTFFTNATRCIMYGLQPRAVQGMLDFDHISGRARPSVAAAVFPFSGNHYTKFYWGAEEVLIPVYTSVEEAVRKHQDAHVFVNFASFRSVYESTMEALAFSHQLRTVAIIAEGVPEQLTRRIIKEAKARGVGVIGPATVGGIKPGAFRIGNSGGKLDNVIASKLYRPGSVAYLSRSGGLSNELNHIISLNTDGVYEGLAIGGDRYPGSRFIDHLQRFNDDPNVKMLVLLGEVGGTDEYDVVEALQDGRITKPLVAWAIGTVASRFNFAVQFGHAGALANAQRETAAAKNAALKAAGATVPDNFDLFPAAIKSVYDGLVASGALVPKPEPPVPSIPMDYAWAKNLGLIRKPSAFVSSISDERGEELTYAGMPITEVFSEGLGVGGVLGLLWFQRRWPDYCSRFVEAVLMITADHGPAVSGAHNTIVTTRAGKDLISSLVSGLLTIGPRFGGALDGAAEMFSEGADTGMPAAEFVAQKRSKNQLIMGIGHKIKSLQNPDARVTIIKEFARAHFAETRVLDFALSVEAVTTKKRSNLILNVDGCIAACFVDMLRGCGAFTREEADEAVANGVLNGLFVLGRSIGFTGHHLDQKRLKQGLYRHPQEDISYINPTMG